MLRDAGEKTDAWKFMEKNNRLVTENYPPRLLKNIIATGRAIARGGYTASNTSQILETREVFRVCNRGTGITPRSSLTR